jgi:hypothetical protein
VFLLYEAVLQVDWEDCISDWVHWARFKLKQALAINAERKSQLSPFFLSKIMSLFIWADVYIVFCVYTSGNYQLLSPLACLTERLPKFTCVQVVMHVNNEGGGLVGTSNQKLVIIMMTKVLYMEFMLVSQLKHVNMLQMILYLYISILLHWCITRTVISISNTRQTVHNLSFILKRN